MSCTRLIQIVCVWLYLQVKQDVYPVSDIPVRHQVWTGWPEAAEDKVSSTV